MRQRALSLALMVVAEIAMAQSAAKTEPALSPAQAAVVNRKIAALHSESDRKAAREWSNSKKIAEILCRPAATAYWKKRAPGTDRVFLGTSDPATLTLESTRRLTGSGQYRTPQGWTDFRFTCDLDPEKGTVTGFETAPAGAGH